MVGLFYWVYKYELGKVAKMFLPKHLTSFEDMSKLSHALKVYMKFSPNAIETLLGLVFFYFQLWHIPLTWAVGLLMGAVMQSVTSAFLLQHVLNVLGVYLVYWQSKIFLKESIKTSEKLQRHLQTIDDKVQEMGPENAIMTMISLRLFPGSPNAIYNYVFPHLPSLTLRQIIIGAFIGQAPYNYFVAMAGQLLSKIHSKSDIIDTRTSIEFIVISLIFMLPTFFTQRSATDSKSKDQKGMKLSNLSYQSAF